MGPPLVVAPWRATAWSQPKGCLKKANGDMSTPGKPPFAHKGGRGPLLRKFLYFGYDPGADTVVVGPVRLGKGEAPPLHEYGGTAKRARVIRTGRKAFTPAQAQAYRRKVQSGQITREKKPTSTFTAKYPERPFMNPALERERPQMASRWKDSIRK